MKATIQVAMSSRGRTRKFTVQKVVEVFAGPAYIAIVTRDREYRVRLNKMTRFGKIRTVRILPG